MIAMEPSSKIEGFKREIQLFSKFAERVGKGKCNISPVILIFIVVYEEFLARGR